jgi:hypothetical protein
MISMKRNLWTPAEDEILCEKYPQLKTREVAALLGRPINSVKTRAGRLGLQKRIGRRLWTKKEDARMRREFPHVSNREIAAKLERSVSSVIGRAVKLNLPKTPERKRAALTEAGLNWASLECSRRHRFPKGNVPMNKGLRRPGYSIGRGRMRETQFKKGQISRNWLPIGNVRPDSDGYLRRKIANGIGGFGNRRTWEFVHRRVWGNAHGRIPAHHKVVFKDGNRRHVALDNLELLSDAELMLRNTIHHRRRK